MSYKIKPSNEFKRKYKKLKAEHIELKNAIDETMLVFSEDSFDSSLNNKPLKREWAGYRSINILYPNDNDYRIIFKDKVDGKTTYPYFLTFGTHKQLYRRRLKSDIYD